MKTLIRRQAEVIAMLTRRNHILRNALRNLYTMLRTLLIGRRRQ